MWRGLPGGRLLLANASTRTPFVENAAAAKSCTRWASQRQAEHHTLLQRGPCSVVNSTDATLLGLHQAKATTAMGAGVATLAPPSRGTSTATRLLYGHERKRRTIP